MYAITRVRREKKDVRKRPSEGTLNGQGRKHRRQGVGSRSHTVKMPAVRRVFYCVDLITSKENARVYT